MLKSVEEGSFTVKQYPSLNGFVKTSSPVVSELFFVCLFNCCKYRDHLNLSCSYVKTCTGAYS